MEPDGLPRSVTTRSGQHRHGRLRRVDRRPLRRRLGRARRRGHGWRAPRQVQRRRLRQPDVRALDAARHARRADPLDRLVRLQRRLHARGRRRRDRGDGRLVVAQRPPGPQPHAQRRARRPRRHQRWLRRRRPLGRRRDRPRRRRGDRLRRRGARSAAHRRPRRRGPGAPPQRHLGHARRRPVQLAGVPRRGFQAHRQLRPAAWRRRRAAAAQPARRSSAARRARASGGGSGSRS